MSHLNYHHLYYFWRVAITGKLTQVASELHVSQSAISAQIKQLEHSMGTPLFYRIGRQLQLTDFGTRVLAYAEDIFSKGEELESLLKKGFKPQTQHLAIGVLINLSRNFIDDFIEPLLADTMVSLSLTAQTTPDLLNGLANHKLDLVLTNRAVTSEQTKTLWQSHLVSRQPVAIVGPIGQQPNKDFPHGYQDAQWILPGKTTEIRSAFEAYCVTHQYQPKVKAEADDMAMLRLLARDSGAFTVLPPVVVKDEIEQKLLAVYQQLPNTYESFYAITVNRKYFPDVLMTLLKNKDQPSQPTSNS